MVNQCFDCWRTTETTLNFYKPDYKMVTIPFCKKCKKKREYKQEKEKVEE